MSGYTGNTMQMGHIVEFYLLEAMRAGLTRASDDVRWKHSFDKLESDIENKFQSMSASIALRLYVYVWAASLGEARHAADRCEYSINEICGKSRNTIFSESLHYFPTDENIKTVKECFDQSWGGSFGGAAWYRIVSALSLYESAGHVTFIDHVIDLEHNTGSVMNKHDAKHTIGLDVSDHRYLESFLSFKFRRDLLKDEYRGYNLEISSSVHSLMQRYSNVVDNIPDNVLSSYVPNLESLSPYSVEWGFETLTLVADNESRTRCENCGDTLCEDDAWLSPNGDTYCEYCYDQNCTLCHMCADIIYTDDAIEIDCCYYCESCAKKVGALCEDCESWVTYEETAIMADSGVCYCEHCYVKNLSWTCSRCGAGHEHEETTTCGDCGHETQKRDECGSEFDEKVVNVWIDGAVREVYTRVYSIPDSPMFMVDYNAACRETGHGDYPGKRWVAVAPFGLWADLTEKSPKAALPKFLKLARYIDWNISKEDFYKLPSSEREAMEKICKAK